MLRFYYHPLSTYARRVHMALLEKTIPFEPVSVDMAAREHRSPRYLALNPYGRVPTLEQDGFVLYESSAILGYLEATHPTPALVPANARGRARVDMHMKLGDLEMTRQTGQIIFPKRFLPEERWDLGVMQKAKREIEAHLAIVERALVDAEYLVEDQFTLADLAYAPFLEFLPLMQTEPAPAVRAWRERLLARPSAQQTKPPR